MSLVNWNVEWATPRSQRTPEIREQIDGYRPDVVCLTETHTELLKGVQDRPLIVTGDFNQRIGQGKFVPPDLRSALQYAMPKHMTIATSALGHRGRRCIDHMALSEEFAAESLSVISNMAGESKLSDHCGVAAILSVQS